MPDLVWRSTATGETFVWRMAGHAVQSSTSLPELPAGTELIAAFDFDKPERLNPSLELNETTGAQKVMILDTPEDRCIEIEDLQLIIKLTSIDPIPSYDESPLMTDDQKDALFWQMAATANHKQVVTWHRRKDSPIWTRLVAFLIFNRQPYYVEDLLLRFTGKESFILAPSSELALSIEATNTGLLTGTDSLTVWGQAYSYRPQNPNWG